jgi:glycosyltransferase involved in cell wall biosynthesis
LALELYFAIPGDIATMTGGYGYDRQLIHELREAGWMVEHLAWGESFPFATASDVAAAGRSLASLPDDSLVLIDGLAFGAVPELAEAEGRRLRLVALVHHPLADETDLGREQRERLRCSERRALAMTRAVVVTSATTAERLVQDYSVEAQRVVVARPGSEPAPLRDSPDELRTGVELLCVGTLTHRKGQDLLIEALSMISELPWACNLVGALERSPEFATKIRSQIALHGFQHRVHLLGSVPDLGPFYERADIFVLASRNEGYGMVFAEAMQQGLPIIATIAGAIPETVPRTAGLLVPPDDANALASALGRLIINPSERARYAAGARAAAASLESWRDTASQVAEVLTKIAAM